MPKRRVAPAEDPSQLDTPATVIAVMQATFGSPRLSVELLRASTWGATLRSALRRRGWDRLRKRTYAAANHR